MRLPAAGLTRRLVLAMGGVVLLSSLLTVLLTTPLLRSTTQSAARESMQRQLTLLARLPTAALSSPRAAQVAARGELQLGVLSPSGTPTGSATLLSRAERRRLLAGGSVSASSGSGSDRVLVEARPTRDGGAVVLVSSDQVVNAAMVRMRRRVLLAACLGLVLATLAAVALASWLTRPLTAVAEAARRLAGGERDVPLPAGGPPEVGDLVAALGHLDGALRTSEDRQRQFLLSVSHELRTPLTVLRGYAVALADGEVSTHELPDVGATLQAEATRMERYVDDLLTLARLEADDFPLSIGPVELDTLVEQAETAWAGRAVGRKVAVATETEEVTLDTDGGRVRQVLDALVDNAVRVTPAGGRVVVAVRPTDGGGVRLEVRTPGPGSPPRMPRRPSSRACCTIVTAPSGPAVRGSAWRSCTGWSAASAARSRSRPPGGRRRLRRLPPLIRPQIADPAEVRGTGLELLPDRRELLPDRRELLPDRRVRPGGPPERPRR
ncbi:MAG: HAMP domain-containing sensor histidine kinase [Nocardioides sp.]